MICNFKAIRKQMGYSQIKLAQISQISLPTIQNIEAGKANPTIDILEKLTHALGLELSISSAPFDAERAISLGVPLLGNSQIKGSEKQLIKESKKWVHLLSNKALKERETEAIVAFLMALKDHFPVFYKNEIACPLFEKEIEESRNNGRIIKLRRIALSNLGQYL
ncbi:MAG: helix-turn-helix transcriptional regulator [Halobacteriovoraceae bacterium]|nr:helix-turn-helix transcriptional regulator [Halobacteriovoraceae bacterium]